MSLLDIDEKLIDLLELIELDKTPLTDIKTMGECDVGLIEGGVCNEENVKILKEFRKHCKILVAVGACAINGGIPAMRNQLSVADCLKEAYVDGDSVVDAQIPNDPELPLLLDKVYPIDEVVKIDYFLPGCPPSADAIWSFLSDLLNNKPITLDYGQIAYD